MKKNKTFIINFLISFTIIFIILLIFYPGLVSYDGNDQWQQVQSGIITNGHPFFSTYFMFLLSKIWNSITVVIIYQILLISICWGYLCKTIKAESKNKKILMYFFTVMVMLTPLVSLYTITVWKDIVYTSYLFLCAIMLYDWSNNKFKLNKLKYCILGLLLAMVFSYRHNGMIVAILLLIIFYILCIRKYRKKIIDKNNFKKYFFALLSFIIIIIAISIPKKIILNQSQKKLGGVSTRISYSTIDSYMLWMMGAHITDNNVKSKRDQQFLNGIIPLNEWKEAYNSYLVNNTNSAKNLNKEYLSKNSSEFEKMFIKYSMKYPLTIFRHYLKSDSLLLNPVSSLKGYVYVFCFPEMEYLPKYTIIKSKIPFLRKFYIKLTDYSFYKPFIIFYQPAFILYLCIIMAIILSKKVYNKKIWIFLLPMFANTISLLPINLAQDLRYVYINYLTFFGLLLMFILNIDKIFVRRKNKEY